MKKVLVVGGRGHLGKKTIEELRGIADVEPICLSRNDLDLRLSKSFPSANEFDVVIICCEVDLEHKISFVKWCIEQNKLVIESTADPRVVAGITRAISFSEGPGSLILGMGVFPGLNNILLKQALDQNPNAEQPLSLRVSTSPFAGAGGDMIDLMIHFLKEPAPAWGGKGANLALDFPENKMISKSCHGARVHSFFRPRPAILTPILAVLRATGLLQIRFVRVLSRFALHTMRSNLLEKVPTPIEMPVRSANGEKLGSINAADGIKVAAQVLAVSSSIAPNTRGLSFPDEVFSMKQLASALSEPSWKWNIEENNGSTKKLRSDFGH